MMLLTFPCISHSVDILFEEDFSGELSIKWTLFGDPLPVNSDSMGLPPPSFNNNGDNLYNSGAISRESFDYSGGLVLECDMYIPSNERGAWISGIIGFGFTREDRGIDGVSQSDITLGYSYLGEANWLRPHLQGTLRTVCNLPDGSKEMFERYHFNQCLDSWHRYSIVIGSDMTVSFYVDSILMHSTELALPGDIGGMVVVLEGRSGAWGRVFHDNVVLIRPD